MSEPKWPGDNGVYHGNTRLVGERGGESFVSPAMAERMRQGTLKLMSTLGETAPITRTVTVRFAGGMRIGKSFARDMILDFIRAVEYEHRHHPAAIDRWQDDGGRGND